MRTDIGAASDPRRRLACGRVMVLATVLLLTFWRPDVAAPQVPDAPRAGSVFTVTGIDLDVRARTAARARDLAMAEGQRQAFLRLLARLTLPEDQGAIAVPNDAAISAMVGGIELANEKSSSTRYLATMTVRFRADAVRGWLRRMQIPFSETALRPVLVLPVYEAAGLRLLWEEPNPWRDAWAEYNTVNALVPFVVPKGDLGDLALVSAIDVIHEREAAIEALARRYQTENALLAVARLDYVAPGRRPRLAIHLRQLGAWGGEVRDLTLEAVAGTSAEDFIAKTVRSIAGDYENAWKRRTITRFDERQSLRASTALAGLEDWLELKRRLEASALVPTVELLSLTSNRAELRIDYLGDFDQLAVSLAQSDVEIEARDGAYVIRKRRPGSR